MYIGVWPPKVCMCMYVCVIYLYNIILYTIYMATVLAVGRKNVICSWLLFDGGLSIFPFDGCIIIKKLLFSLRFFLPEPIIHSWGGVVTQNRLIWRGFLYIGFFYYIRTSTLSTRTLEPTEEYLKFCKPNKYSTFVLRF